MALAYLTCCPPIHHYTHLVAVYAGEWSIASLIMLNELCLFGHVVTRFTDCRRSL